MNNCRVGTEEWVHNLASTLLTEFKDSSLTEDQVINVITSKFNTSYNNEPNTQTIETFKDVVINTLNKPILKLKHPWLNKYRDSKILDDLINPNKSQSTEIDKFDYGSKHDNNDETNQIIDTDTFVYSVYGYTSAALADMQLRFTTLMRDCIFFDYKTGKECISQEQFNKNIEFYLEGLWKSVCDNISNTLGIDYKSLFSSEIELNTVGNYFNGFTSEAINKLYEDSDSGSKKVMDAFQNYFIIKNFDMLIQRYYGKSIFVHDYEFKNIVTPVSADHLKYSLAGFNYNLENNWSSESEVNDVTEETSDFVKLFINSCMLLDRKNNDNPLRPLNIREVAFLWGNIKRQQYNQKEKFSKKVLDNMLKNKDITEEEYNFLTKPDKDFGFKVPKHSLYSLIQKSYEDTTFVIPLIFKLASLNEKYSLGINLQNQGDVIYSIYKQAFSEDSKLRKAWESRTLSDFGSQPKSYYQYLTHFFNMQSHVIMTEYEQGDEGEFEVNTLGEASLNRHILYYQDMINGKFSALVNSHYNKKAFEQKRESFSGFILDRTKLSQDVKNSFVEVKFNDDNTILRIFPTLTTQVSFNNGRTFQNTDNIKLGENSELCEFVRYVLDLNFNNFRTQVLPNLKINNVNLLNAAATVLFNYSVSCEILNEENSKAAEEKAKKYYSSGLDKNIRTQRYTKELNSFTTNVIQNTIKDLQEKIDLLNGTLREASAKDADGHTINTMSTSQLMDKEDTNLQAIQDALENGEECVYSDLYTISQVYEGFEISRDIKTNYDENKKTVELKPSDLSAFTFVYDFASEILKADDDKTPSIMKILPCIISDKPRSLRIKVNLDKVVNGKKLKDFSKDELIQLAKQELGNFYLKVYNTIEGEWQKLNKISKENFDLIPISYSQDIKYFLDRTKEFEGIDLFSLKNNFNGINSLQDEFVEKTRNELSEETKNFLLSSYIIEETKRTGRSYDILNQEILNDVNNPETTHYQNYQNKINKYLNDRAIKATNDLIHFLINKYLESGENIEISKNYSFIQRKGERHLLLNYSLAEELYKWGIKDKYWFNSHSNGLNSPYDSAEQFFDNKNKQWVSDFLQFGGRIGFTNKFEEVTPGILKRLSEFEGWSRNNNLVLAKINIDSNTFDIINIDSLAEVKIIQYAFELAKFYPAKGIDLSEYNSVNPIESLYKWLESPEFSFEQLEKVINYYYEIQNKEIKSEKFAEKVLKAKIDSVNEFVKQGKIAQGIADNIIKNFESHKNSLKDKKIEKHSTFITINPLIEQFNMLSYIFGQEYMNTIVGSYIQHPGKNHSDLQAFSSEQLLQQVKRNVILSATEHQFQLNEFDGLPSDVKMAEIQNTSDIMYTINGEEDKVLDDDGTLYVNGVTSYYENYSLKGSAVGVDKKTIFWSQNRRTGNNKFIKCAGFPVTNQRVRNSKFWRYLNYRALKGVDKELEPYLQNGGLDITKNFLGEDVNYQWFSYKRTWLGLEDQIVNYLQISDVVIDQDGNKQYIEKPLEEIYNGEIVTITNIEFNPNTGYSEFTVNGNRKQAVKLKNMHDIWLFFGGAYSMSLTENQIQGDQEIKGNEYNEESFERTAFCGNCVGKVKDGATVIRNQHQVDQYLKKSIIHYFPTTEATKCGQSNSNPKSFIYKLDLNLNYSTENLYNAGPQLNAEHESDESILSMMTQVVNALGSRGHTAYQANKVYKALRVLTEVSLKPFIDSLNYSNVGNIDLAKNRMADFIVNIVKNSIKSGKISSSPETLTDLLYQQTLLTLEKNKGVLKYEDIQSTLPIDNPILLKNIMSKLASTLVKTSIRLKFPGTMDVLSPSNGIYKLYDDRLLSYYEGTSVKDLPNRQVTDLSNLEIGRTYYCEGYYEGNTVKLNTPRDYYLLREYIQQYNVPVYEVISEGRDLASYNVKFKDLITGTQYNIWDLDVVKQSFYKEGLNDNFRNLLQQQLNSLSNYTVNNQVTINGEPIIVDKNSIKVIPYEIIMSKLYQTQFGLRTGDDVRTISEDKLFFLKRFFEETTDKSISDNEYDVKLSTIDGNYKYLITGNVPKGFKKLDFTPIQDSDGNFWYVNYRGVKTEQLSSQNDEIYSNGRVLLIKTNNITFYLDTVKHNKVELSSKIKSKENLLNILDQLDNSESEYAKFLVEKFDKFLNEGEEGLEYEVDGEERTTKIDIVKKLVNLPQAVEKFQNYINSYNYYQEKNIKTIKKILNNAEYAIDLVAKDLTPEHMQNIQIEELENVIEQVKQDLRSKYSDSEIKQMAIENLAKKNRWIKNQLNTSIDIHTSFLKSLEILAARIPAQCMQSFMSMKIVGFEESGLNVAYVSRAQIYLQGSDFKL